MNLQYLLVTVAKIATQWMCNNITSLESEELKRRLPKILSRDDGIFWNKFLYAFEIFRLLIFFAPDLFRTEATYSQT